MRETLPYMLNYEMRLMLDGRNILLTPQKTLGQLTRGPKIFVQVAFDLPSNSLNCSMVAPTESGLEVSSIFDEETENL